jgi:hypothetical protein
MGIFLDKCIKKILSNYYFVSVRTQLEFIMTSSVHCLEVVVFSGRRDDWWIIIVVGRCLCFSCSGRFYYKYDDSFSLHWSLFYHGLICFQLAKSIMITVKLFNDEFIGCSVMYLTVQMKEYSSFSLDDYRSLYQQFSWILSLLYLPIKQQYFIPKMAVLRNNIIIEVGIHFKLLKSSYLFYTISSDISLLDFVIEEQGCNEKYLNKCQQFRKIVEGENHMFITFNGFLFRNIVDEYSMVFERPLKITMMINDYDSAVDLRGERIFYIMSQF